MKYFYRLLFFSDQNLSGNVNPSIGPVTEKKNNGKGVGAHVNIIHPDLQLPKVSEANKGIGAQFGSLF